MKLFCRLWRALDETEDPTTKVRALVEYFSEASDEDCAWAVALIKGKAVRRATSAQTLLDWARHASNLPKWLVDESVNEVGDLSETAAMILPASKGNLSKSQPWHWWCEMATNRFADLGSEEQAATVLKAWQPLETPERIILNKLLTGSLRVSCSLKEVEIALWMITGIDQSDLAHRLSKSWSPTATSYQELISPDPFQGSISRPYPLRQLDEASTAIENIDPEHWRIDWLWTGQRVQIVSRKGVYFLWSLTNDLLNERFPDLLEQFRDLPDGVVLEGFLVSLENHEPSGTVNLRKRLGRLIPSAKAISESPVGFMTLDVLEWDGVDLRDRPLCERLLRAGELAVGDIYRPVMVPWTDSKGIPNVLSLARSIHADGILLRRKDGLYESLDQDWIGLLNQPVQIHAVLMYVQMSNINDPRSVTEYTLGVWNEGVLVTIGKFLGNLPSHQQRAIAEFARANTLERFGPVRTVRQEIVFRIEFDAVEVSTRHKAGLLLRGGRILSWEMDKRPAEASKLSALKSFIP